MILNELDENDDCCQRRFNIRRDHANELHLALDCSESWRVSEELERILLVDVFVVVFVELLHADDNNDSNDRALQTSDNNLASPSQITSRCRASRSGNITCFINTSLQQQRAARETTSHQVE